jgi:AcrR family transcriptional regulator
MRLAKIEAVPGRTYTTEELCGRIVERHRERIKVRKPSLVVANLSRIVTAFLKLSNRQGFHATSLRELAEVSGLSMGGLYTYFDSKETLLLMVLDEVADTMRELLAAVPAEVAADPRAHLRWLIASHVRLSEAMQPWFVFVFMEAKSFPPSARRSAVDSEMLAEAELAAIFERGTQAAVFAVAEPQLAAALVKPLLQDWYVKRAKYRKRGIGIDAYIEGVTGFVERATLKAG